MSINTLHKGDDDEDNNIYLLQLVCYPMAVVSLHVHKILNWLLINLSREGYMRSMQWQLGILGTISAFAYRHRENFRKSMTGLYPQSHVSRSHSRFSYFQICFYIIVPSTHVSSKLSLSHRVSQEIPI